MAAWMEYYLVASMVTAMAVMTVHYLVHLMVGWMDNKTVAPKEKLKVGHLEYEMVFCSVGSSEVCSVAS